MKSVLMLMAAIILLAACSKKDTNTATNAGGNKTGVTLTEEEKFLVGDWMFEKSIDSLHPKNTPQDLKIKEGIIPCKMDDIYHLRTDKKYTKDEGKDTCTQNAYYGENDWGLSYGGITFADGPNPYKWANKFYKIDNDHFIITWSNQDWDGNHTLAYYFKRKP